LRRNDDNMETFHIETCDNKSISVVVVQLPVSYHKILWRRQRVARLNEL